MFFFSKVAEIIHLQGELFGSAPVGKSLVAIGLYYQQLANDTKSYFYYRWVKVRLG
jgi:hypothetical protein